MGYNRNEGDGNEQKFAMDILIGYVTMCDSAKSCSSTDCPLGVLAANGKCAEMIQRFPEKALLVIQDYINKPWTYFDEYKKRFPFSKVTLEDIAYDVCRRKCFEGATDCTRNDCLECWSQEYLFDKDDSASSVDDKDTLDDLFDD